MRKAPSQQVQGTSALDEEVGDLEIFPVGASLHGWICEGNGHCPQGRKPREQCFPPFVQGALSVLQKGTIRPTSLTAKSAPLQNPQPGRGQAESQAQRAPACSKDAK